MKKTLLLLIAFALVALLAVSCGSADTELSEETKDPLAGAIRTEGPKTEAETTKKSPDNTLPDASEYAFFQVFNPILSFL